MRKRKEMFIDIETTGLDASKDVITQIGFVYKEGSIVKRTVDIKGDEIYKRFLAELDKCVDRYNKNDKMYFLAYNAAFDSAFIRKLFEKNNNQFYGSYFYHPYIDVMQIAARWYMRRNEHPENFKLSTICKDFGIKVDDTKLHDALYDIQLTRRLYSKLIKH